MEIFYIDKTIYIKKILNDGDKLFFLQRPRRFGKSLLLSTMASVFRGQSHLFDGLGLNSSNYKFVKFPILYFDLPDLLWKTGSARELDLYTRICIQTKSSFGYQLKARRKFRQQP
jgi:hypothetical protein